MQKKLAKNKETVGCTILQCRDVVCDEIARITNVLAIEVKLYMADYPITAETLLSSLEKARDKILETV